MQKTTQTRLLKVYSRHLLRSMHTAVMPEIRLCGRWLHAAGFGCGCAITIQHTRNRLIIKPVKEDTSPVKQAATPLRQ